jgi:hypothetical protein
LTDKNEPEEINLPAVADGLAPGWRKSVAKVALCLGIGTDRGAKIYAAGRAAMDDIEGRSLVSRALYERVAVEVAADSQLVSRTKNRLANDLLQKQINLEAVMLGAGGIIESNSSTNRSEKEECGIEDGVSPLDPDWSSAFTQFAEGASTDELRDRLSRVLAGEITCPGSFSRATLRLITELDRADLEALKIASERRVANYIHMTGWQENQHLALTLLLEEAGLTVDTGLGLSIPIKPNPHGDEWRFVLTGEKHVLVMQKGNAIEIVLPVRQLTRAGRAVSDLISSHDERRAFRTIAQSFSGAMSEISIGRIIDRIGGSVKWSTIEAIKSRPAPPPSSIAPSHSGFGPK